MERLQVQRLDFASPLKRHLHYSTPSSWALAVPLKTLYRLALDWKWLGPVLVDLPPDPEEMSFVLWDQPLSPKP